MAEPLTGRHIDVVDVRAARGMVFQARNPFPQEHLDQCGVRPDALYVQSDAEERSDDMDRGSLRQAALWDESEGQTHDRAWRSPAGSSSVCASARGAGRGNRNCC